MNKDEFLAEAARIHDEWAATANVVVEDRWAGNSPSQYAEGIEATSPVASDDREYLKQIKALRDEYYASQGRARPRCG